MAQVDPVIVVPGITASYLDDVYPLPPRTIWSVMTKVYERAALHPDDLRYEAVEPALVRPGQLVELAYRELIEELRYNLADREDRPVPVFPFSYDWRQPLEMSGAQLGSFIEEVISRTKLMRHYDRAGYDEEPRVNLVGHSMGGLVIATWLKSAGKESRVRRVVSLATPFRGSFEAVIKVTTGTANLGSDAPSSREREAARLTPALYYLFPDLPDAVETDADDIPKDLFDSAAWQPSVVGTIQEYIRLRGLESRNRGVAARELFEALLGAARAHREGLKDFRLDQAGLGEADWLCIAGVDSETRVRLRIVKRRGAPDFAFDSADRANQWRTGDVPGQRRRTGDGTVPFDAALPHFLPEERVVCVRPDDFGYWEVVDRVAMRVGGFHALLPAMDMLHRLIVRFFKNRDDPRGNTWGVPAPGVDERAWAPPVRGSLRIRA